MDSPLRVLGVDPGLTRLGYAVVQESSGALEAVVAGTIETSAGEPPALRLHQMFTRLTAVLDEWTPRVVAVERVFLKLNAKTAVTSIQASGVVLLAAARHGAEIAEFSPAEVKQSVVGTGAASKQQVRFMVTRLLGGKVDPDTADAADALAVAISYLNSRRMIELRKAVL